MKQSNMMTIIRKEFARFFGDRSMVFTALIMPGLLIYIIYSLMGNSINEGAFTVASDEAPTVYVENLPASLTPLFDSLPVTLIAGDCDEEEMMALVDDKENHVAYVLFPPAFDSLCAAYDPAGGTPAPNVAVYYNSTNDGSRLAYTLVTTTLQAYEESLCNRFDVNRADEEETHYDRTDDEELISTILSKLIPMLLLMLMFSGCMAVAPASIAGEKERGTIATLLVTPMRRSELALGKIISLSCFALLSGISSFLGIILSLPKMIHADSVGVDLNLYSASDFLLLLVVLLSTVLLLISIVANLSALARDVKQASTINIPLSLMMIVVGMLPMMMSSTPDSMSLYLIPFYNSVMSMTAVLAHEASMLAIAVTMGVNILYAVCGAWILTKLISSERVMFSK